MRGEGVEGRRQVVAWHAPPAFAPRGEGETKKGRWKERGERSFQQAALAQWHS